MRSSYDVVFDDIIFILLAYTSQPYAEDMSIQPDVSHIPYSTSSREKRGDIITFEQFEDGDLLSETFDNTESVIESDDESTLPPSIIEEDIDAMSPGNESDDEPISMDIFEDIRDGGQYNLSINRREVRYKILDHIKLGQSECKKLLLET